MFSSHRRTLAAALMALAAGVGTYSPPARQRASKKMRSRANGWLSGRVRTGCGARECARRLRQIEAGQLGRSNGLHIARPVWVGVDPGAPEGDRTVDVPFGRSMGKTEATIGPSTVAPDIDALKRALEAGRA